MMQATFGTAETGEVVDPSAFDEERLARSIREGDRRAAEELVERTYGGIYRALARLCGGDSELAADLTQDTYRKAWQALPQFDGRSRFSTWLYRIAYTTFLNHIRTPRRVIAVDDQDLHEASDPAPGAEEMVQQNEQASELRLAVIGLPDDLRFTVTASFWGELPVKEIARLEGITTVAVRKRLSRAFRLLEAALQKEKS